MQTRTIRRLINGFSVRGPSEDTGGDAFWLVVLLGSASQCRPARPTWPFPTCTPARSTSSATRSPPGTCCSTAPWSSAARWASACICAAQIQQLPAHKSMLDVAEIIFQTCKTYLIQQGKFLLMLFVLIAIAISYYLLGFGHAAEYQLDRPHGPGTAALSPTARTRFPTT